MLKCLKQQRHIKRNSYWSDKNLIKLAQLTNQIENRISLCSLPIKNNYFRSIQNNTHKQYAIRNEPI